MRVPAQPPSIATIGLGTGAPRLISLLLSSAAARRTATCTGMSSPGLPHRTG